MSDQRIRELERAFAETSDPAIGGRLLQARERAGELPPRAIEVLAHLGDAAACQLLRRAPASVETAPELASWLIGIQEQGRVVWGRALHALQQRSLAELVAGAGPLRPAGHAAVGFTWTWLDDLRQWILAGCPEEPPALPMGRGPLGRSRPYGLPVASAELNFVQRLLWSSFSWFTDLKDLRQLLETPWVYALRDPLQEYRHLEQAQLGSQVRGIAHAIQSALAPWLYAQLDPLLAVNPFQDLLYSLCEEPWTAMQGGARARRCAPCGRGVFNVSGLDHAAARDLICQQAHDLGAKLYRRADGTLMTRACRGGLRGHMSPRLSMEPEWGQVTANPMGILGPGGWGEVTVNPVGGFGPAGDSGSDESPSLAQDPPAEPGGGPRVSAGPAPDQEDS